MKEVQDPDTPKHKTGYWWFGMAVTGGLSLLFNLWAIIDPPKSITTGQATTNLLLGIVVHASPVLLSALVSHGFKTELLGKWERGIIVVLFLGFMGVSIHHQALLLMTYTNPVAAWFIPIAIDTIALLFLKALLTAYRLNREAEENATRERDMSTLRESVRRDIEPDIRREAWVDMEAEMERRRVDIERDIEARLRVDIERDIRESTRVDMEAEWAAKEEELKLRALAQVRREAAAERKPAKRAKTATSKTKTPAAEEDGDSLTSEERKKMAAMIVAESPDITHKDLGAALGVVPRQAARIRASLDESVTVE